MTDPAPQQCQGRTLYMGHCHVAWMKREHCKLVGADAKIKNWRQEPPCPPYASYAGNQYLDWSTVVADISRTGAFRSAGFRTVILSTWAWDMIHRNSHPSIVYQEVKTAMSKLMPYQQFGLNQSRASLSRATAAGARPPSAWMLSGLQAPLKFVVVLPHYHRTPSFTVRAPCQTERRVRLYTNAMEAAAYDFKLQMEAEATFSGRSQPEAEVVLLDLYNWTKQLGNIDGAVKEFGGDKDYEEDGSHLQRPRWVDLDLALLERGVICGPKGKTWEKPPRSLSLSEAPNLLRPPRDTRDYYLKPIEAGLFGDPEAANVTEKSADDLNWPSLPTCESRVEGSTSQFFWGNQLSWLLPTTWSNFMTGLGNLLERGRYPRADVLRYQTLQVVRNGTLQAQPFVQARFQVTECLGNVGLTENATSWVSGLANRGNVEYILWQRSRARGNRSDSLSSLSGKELKRSVLAQVQDQPPAKVPTCVCANRTHLVDAVHIAMVQRAADGLGDFISATEVEAAIAKHCESALLGFDPTPTAGTDNTTTTTV